MPRNIRRGFRRETRRELYEGVHRRGNPGRDDWGQRLGAITRGNSMAYARARIIAAELLLEGLEVGNNERRLFLLSTRPWNLGATP